MRTMVAGIGRQDLEDAILMPLKEENDVARRRNRRIGLAVYGGIRKEQTLLLIANNQNYCIQIASNVTKCIQQTNYLVSNCTCHLPLELRLECIRNLLLAMPKQQALLEWLGRRGLQLHPIIPQDQPGARFPVNEKHPAK